MAVSFGDMIEESTTTTGTTSPFDLGGAVSGKLAFSSQISSGATVKYRAFNGNTFEVGEGTFTTGSPDTLSRDTIEINSSGGTSKINFSNAPNVLLVDSATWLGNRGMELLASTTLGSDSSDITFTGIDQDYQALYLLIATQTDRSDQVDNVAMRVGSGSIDSGSNYDRVQGGIKADGGTAQDGAASDTLVRVGATSGATNSESNRFSTHSVTIDNYADTTLWKRIRADAVYATDPGGTISSDFIVLLTAGWWRNTGAMDQLQIFPDAGTNLKANTKVFLFGVK